MHTLDTSGVVLTGNLCPHPTGGVGFVWSDLDPFTQGYVEALCASHWMLTGGGMARAHGAGGERRLAFSDLSPEALAMILRDCSSFVNIAAGLGAKRLGPVEGGRFWRGRRERFHGGDAALVAAFPPLTITLGDDGKVHLDGAS